MRFDDRTAGRQSQTDPVRAERLVYQNIQDSNRQDLGTIASTGFGAPEPINKF